MKTAQTPPPAPSKRVLFVHQGAELYGSDKTFEQSVRGLRQSAPDIHITVLVAAEGPLLARLQNLADEILIEPLFVLRRQLLRSGTLFNLPVLWRAVRCAIARLDNFDAVYINTAVIVDYIIASRLRGTRTIVHVHELPAGSSRFLFRLLLFIASATVIFNSQATRLAFASPLDRRHLVVPNGTLISSPAPLLWDGIMRILMIGRFNSWKGQKLLVKALTRLPPDTLARTEVIFAGGVYQDQHHFKEEVVALIHASDLGSRVTIKDFVEDPADLFHWSTAVAVPSTLPEPFGLVAIEAMGHGRPVIAAGHGGLAEIVVDGHTGVHFTPGDETALAAAMQKYFEQPELLHLHGKNGQQRYHELYREDRYLSSIAGIIHSLLS